jgi:ABC-2 type transport system permease protein
MKQIDNLWKERLQLYSIEMRRYLKYIFNDHLLFVAIFALSGGAYYYSSWVKTIDSSFPIGLVMGIVLGICLTVSPIYTLLKEADKVFLLPIETRLHFYFRKAISLSFVIQAYILLMVLAVLMPMYVQSTGSSYRSFFYLLIVILIMKYWNLLLQWAALKYQDNQVALIHWIIRFALNSVFIFFIVEKASFWLIGLLILLFIGAFIYFHQGVKAKTLKWDLLVEKEERRLTAFYRFANLFTDVPKLKGQIKRRKWLDPFINGIRYDQKNTYRFLFARTFIRASEYFGLFVRLTILGGLILFFSDQRYLMMGIAILFLYLTGFQLIPMIRFHELKIWMNLYPIQGDIKVKSFLKVIHIVLNIQAVIFGVLAIISSTWLNGVIVFIVSIVFVFILVKVYIPSRLRKIGENY